MKVVIALSGNALLKRGEPMEAGVQRRNVTATVEVALMPDGGVRGVEAVIDKDLRGSAGAAAWRRRAPAADGRGCGLSGLGHESVGTHP